jgi:monothiol glutaredoxin
MRRSALRAASRLAPRRMLSAESHPDFAPQRKAPALDTDANVKAFVDELLGEHKTFLFMKGTPEAPQCGFSQQVVRILHVQGAAFGSANVLESAELREGIKSYSSWPTIPQLYHDGEFVGGCDIITTMHQSGELEELFKEE